MGVKIQIASKEALERLIANDGEIEIELRRSVMENFAKGHIKALASTDIGNVIRKEADNIRTAMQDQIEKEFFEPYKATNSWGAAKLVLKSKYRNELGDSLSLYVREAIRDLVKEELERGKYSEQLKAFIGEQAHYIREEWSKQAVTSRIDKIVDEKIKQKLGLS